MRNLEEQLKFYNRIRNGDATWSELNEYRVSIGEPSMTVDSLRRQFQIIGKILDENFTITAPDMDDEEEDGKIYELPFSKSINPDGTFSSEKIVNEDVINDAVKLLSAHGYDPMKFTLISSKSSRWTNGKKELYSSKVTVKPLQNAIDYESVTKHFENFTPPKFISNKTVKRDEDALNKMQFLFVGYSDIHFGKKSCTKESEGTDWELSTDRIVKSAMEIVEKHKGEQIGEVIVRFGDDFFNSTITNPLVGGATAKGTPQRDEINYDEMFEKGLEAFITAVDILTEIAPVSIVLVQGNHCPVVEFYGASLLKAYYRNSPNVTVDAVTDYRKYVNRGKVMLGMTHEQGKVPLETIMPAENPVGWANAKYRYAILGHMHKLDVDTTKNGIQVWTLPTFTTDDAWLNKEGFISSQQQVMCMLFDADRGLKTIDFINF